VVVNASFWRYVKSHIISKLLLSYYLDKDFSHTANKQKTFLSWQSKLMIAFLFLKIYSMGPSSHWYCIYGFKVFCKHFFEQHPEYFISPLRISGSAIENLFSQFKHNAGRKLDAYNYATARYAHMVKQSASAHHSGSGYRDQTLSYMREEIWHQA